MKRFNILKTTLSLILIIAITAGLTGCGIIQSLKAKEIEEENEILKNKILVLELSNAYSEIRRLVTTMCLFASFNDPKRIESFLSDAESAYDSGLNVLDEYESNIKNGNLDEAPKKDELARLNELKRLFTLYKSDVFDPVYEMAHDGDSESALAYMSDGIPLALDLKSAIDYLIKTFDDDSL